MSEDRVFGPAPARGLHNRTCERSCQQTVVDFLTTYAMTVSAEAERQLRRAYPDHRLPDTAARARSQEGPSRTCSMPDCDKSARSCGWCYDHCNVIHRHVSAQQRLCSVEGCSRPHEARGWCHTHYERRRRNGDPLYVRPPKPVPSSAEVRAEMRQALARLSEEVAG